jgi:hypothetical protein
MTIEDHVLNLKSVALLKETTLMHGLFEEDHCKKKLPEYSGSF